MRYEVSVPDELDQDKARLCLLKLEALIQERGEFVFLRVPPGFPMERMPEAILRVQHMFAQFMQVAGGH